MEISFVDESFCCWGRGSQGGTYLLRLTVSQSISVCFGRFKAGEPVAVPRGNYLYVGSALAQKGATSLAQRLLRHASRSDAREAQPIRQKMLDLFPRIGLGANSLYPPIGKRLHWHVDFLLDEPVVELTAVYLIRTVQENLREDGKRRGEKTIARWLLTLPEVSPLAPGLGATDDPGRTHLLRVTAVSNWWNTFPNRLSNFLRGARV